MFLDPEKSALIVLGASVFADPAYSDRKVFASAKESMIDYFLDPWKGLGLRDSHVFDGFDADNKKNDIISEMNDFLRKKSLDDVFVYICSHGQKRGKHLNILLRTSEEGNFDSELDFEYFIDKLQMEVKCRIYCIVDCCDSGVIHESSTQLNIPDETVVPPKMGITILTSNNRETIGRVIAADNLDKIDAPLFTHILLQVLEKGEKKLPRDGIAFEHIWKCIRERIPEVIRDLDLGSERQDMTKETCGPHGEDADLMQDSHRTNIPDVSDRPQLNYRPGHDGNEDSGRKLSQICVFKNNSYPNKSRDGRNLIGCRSRIDIKFHP